MNESKLNSDETIIYDILKEYLKKKSFHPGLDIVDYLNNRLKSNPDFNRNKIELIIKSLTEKKIIVPGTKLIKEDVLEIPLRRKIYRHINRNPGVNVYEIRKDLNIGSNQATWHLKKLEQFQFIKSAKIGNKKVFFNSSLDPAFYEIYFYLRENRINKIIKLFKKKRTQSGLMPSSISKELNMHYNTIKKYLNILTELHLIKSLMKNNQKRYLLNYIMYDEKLDDIKNYSKKVRDGFAQEFLLDICS